MSPTAPADTALVNGAVYTVDAARSWAQAVAITDGRIAIVGTDDDVRQAIGPATEVVDLAGRMLVPGFQSTGPPGAKLVGRPSACRGRPLHGKPG